MESGSERAEKFRRDLLLWAEENLRHYPWRELDRSLYEVFVAEFFLTQTPADNVEAIYSDFLAEYPNLEHIRESPQEELEGDIEPIGFQNMRARALKDIARQYDRLPSDREELTTLPRVGRYVANTTVCLALREPLAIVDRNVERVYSRVFGESWPVTEEEKWAFAERMLPENNVRGYNLSLLDFGHRVCSPNPDCESCFANEICSYYQDL